MMKTTRLLKSMLLLCALIVGSNCAWAVDYVKVTKNSDLVSGDTYIIATTTAVATAYSSSSLTTTDTGFTHSEGTISTTTASPMEFTLQSAGDGKYALKMSSNRYLGYNSSANFRNSESASTAENEQWTIAYNSTYTMYTIVNASATGRHIGTGNSVFKPYTSMSNNAPATLYKKVAAAVAAPTFTPAAGTFITAQSVTLSCATDGATIYYTLDGTTPTSSSSVYSSAISVSETKTIKAIAKKGSDYSSVAVGNYRIVTIEHAGTEGDPYSVADARNSIDANTGLTNVYATGKVSEIVTAYNGTNKNISFNISTDGETTSDQLQAYRCISTEGVTDVSEVMVGDLVVVKGTLTKYNSTYEFTQNCKLVSIDHGGVMVDCATPTFSVAAGTIFSAQDVTISTTTPGATIYFTTNGDDPTTSSDVYSSAISVDADMTIKALAVKDGYNNSSIASATYTFGTPITSYSINFEDPIEAYANWNFTNIARVSTSITAHGGTYYGNTDGKATASITTKEIIALPGLLTCYISKESTNTTASTWKIETSTNGSDWTAVASKSAIGMDKGVWQVFSADLSAYSNVYVRLSYGSNTGIRAVDDITLTFRPAEPTVIGETVTVPVSVNMDGWRSFIGEADQNYTIEDGAKVYYVSETNAGTKKVTLAEIADGIPANTPVILHKDGATFITLTKTATVIAAPSGNKLAVSTAGQNLSAGVYRLGYKTSDGVGFYKYSSTSAPAGIIYISALDAGANFLGFDFDETTGIENLTPALSQGEGAWFDLQGRRVAQPTKGLYIVNGKKVIIK